MAEQEFLASFAVEIDESGVEQLQSALEKNRELADALAAAFDRAHASVQAFFQELSEMSFSGLDFNPSARVTEAVASALSSQITEYIRDTAGVLDAEDVWFAVSGRQFSYACTVRTEEGSAAVAYETAL